MSEKGYILSPVGKLQASPDGYVLKIFPRYRAALNGLDGFGHINVIWWSHYLDTAEYHRIWAALCSWTFQPGHLCHPLSHATQPHLHLDSICPWCGY